MSLFDRFYYSWSPSVADNIRTNDGLRSATRALITPLLGVLHVAILPSSVFHDAEVGIVVSGVLASAMLGVVYVAPVLLGLTYVVGRGRCPFTARRLGFLTVALLISLGVVVLAGALMSVALMMIGTGALVIISLALSAFTFTALVVRGIKEIRRQYGKSIRIAI